MKKETQELCKKIMDAIGPEEIFGDLGGASETRDKKLRQLENEFQKLKISLSVDDSNSAASALAKIDEARIALEEMYNWARSGIISGTYGIGEQMEETPETGETDEAETPIVPRVQTKEVTITTKKRDYYIIGAVAEGDISTIYRGYYLDEDRPEDVLIKIVRESDDNEFAKREAQVLALLFSEPNNEGRQLKHLPKLVDQFQTKEGRRGNILSDFSGYDLTTVRANRRYQDGVDRKHMVWMLSRLLSAIGYAHSKRVLHTNLSPSSIMIRPRDHNLCVIDWSYAIVDPATAGAKFTVFDEEYSAPEIKLRPELLPVAQVSTQAEGMYLNALRSSDIYSIGKCMVYILGGNVETNEMPDDVEPPLQQFIRGFLLESPLQRERDAWELYRKLRTIILELWGERKFMEFKM